MHLPNATLHRHEQFQSAFLPEPRDVLVWLPPGYELEPGRRFPVLYMHDGQNLFEPDTAFQKGEHWRVGETAAELMAAGRLEPLIIVGINNTGEERIHEYTPTRDARLGGGLAGAYGRLIIDELKPMIDDTYRTLPEAAQTGLGGSSLGGLVTLHLGFTHPDVFSRLAVLSPSVWWDRRTILTTVRQTRPRPRLRLWVDMGTAEGRRGLDDARLLKAALVGAGYQENVDLHYAEFEGATHSEAAWAARVGPMLTWLFPPTPMTR
ncbi:MAG: alpha/beta hydrolase [Vicinamibacterales bacterium]